MAAVPKLTAAYANTGIQLEHAIYFMDSLILVIDVMVFDLAVSTYIFVDVYCQSSAFPGMSDAGFTQPLNESI